MTDIVERLRYIAVQRFDYEGGNQPWSPNASSKLLLEAADEIERMRANLAQRDHDLTLTLQQLERERGWTRHDRHR